MLKKWFVHRKKCCRDLKKTKEMLTNVNSLSAVRLEKANNDFKKHTQNVVEMKKDLESIFRRLKIIKQKLNKQMPDACDAVMGSGVDAREEDDEYDEAFRRRQ